MAQQSVPSSPQLKYTYYTNLRGVDFSHEAISVDRYHASDMLNMMPDYEDGTPVKRKGWRNVEKFPMKIIGAYHDEYDNFDLIATDSALYFGDTEKGVAFSTVSDSVTFNHYDGLVYVIGWERIFTVDKDFVIKDVEPTIPTTVISRLPDGTGGEDYQAVNALTDYRRIQFYTENATKTFVLYPTDDHKISDVSVEYMADSGWTPIDGWTFDGKRTITFTSEPKVSESGRDNLRATFKEESTQLSTLRENILKSDIVTVNDERLFAVVDNNKIYYTEAGDLTYFPDDNYVVAGNDAPIMGLHKKNGAIYAVTGSSSEHSVFILQSQSVTVNKTVIQSDWTTTTEVETINYYSVQSSLAGSGAVAKKTFVPLIDDPLFLGRDGIYSVYNSSLTTRTMLINRSTNINKKLNDEPHKEKAVAVEFMGNYILSVNGHCYLLDSRETFRDNAKNYCYEAYYWDLNLNYGEYVTTFLAYDENLYFGTSENRWCKFNFGIDSSTSFCDNGKKDGHAIVDGEAIKAYYTIRLDDDGMPQYLKTMQKKGCVVTLKPFAGSTVDVYYSKNGEHDQLLTTFPVSNGSFDKIDFSAFSFDGGMLRLDRFIRKKIKKYTRLSLTFRNDYVNQGLGIIQFTKTWTVGNFAKGK